MTETAVRIDLRGKSAQEVVHLLAEHGYKTHWDDFSKVYRFYGEKDTVHRIPLYHDKRALDLTFVLWDGHERQPESDWDLVLFDPGGVAEWGMANTWHLMH